MKRKKQKALAKASLAGNKATIADVDARFLVDNEKAIEEWDKKLDNARQEVGILASYYEGWKQKSFSIKAKIEIDQTERYNVNDTTSGEKSGNVSPRASMNAVREKAKQE